MSANDELRDKIRAAWPDRALTHGRRLPVPPVRDGGNTAACIDLAVELAVEHFAQAPCVMTHTEPFDFAQCETHDETFPLGETCRFDGRDMVEVLFEAADEQRMRAVRAEHKLDLAREAIESLRNVITTSSLDWGSARDVAWVYGIVVGWDSDPDDEDDLDAMGELAERWGWTPETVQRLRHLHRALGGAA